MITANLSIIVALSTVTEPKTDKKKNTKKNQKSKHPAKSKKGKSKSSEGKVKKQKSNLEDKNDTPQFDAAKPLCCAHIEYKLFPHKFPCQVDIKCWGPIAKIYYGDEEQLLPVTFKDNISWIPIKITHYLHTMDTDQLLQLHSHTISYTVSTDKNKIGQRAKSDQSKIIYTPQENNTATKPDEASLGDASKHESTRAEYLLRQTVGQMIQRYEKIGNSQKDEILLGHLNYFPDNVHDFMVSKLIQNAVNGLSNEYKEYAPVCPMSTVETHAETKVASNVEKKKTKKSDAGKKKKNAKKKEKSASSKKSGGKRGRAGKKGKEKDTGPSKIDVPGEIFFADPNLSVYRLQNANKSVTDGYVISTITKLLTKIQKYDLNPIVIKIKKITKLPVDMLRKQGYKAVKAHYNIPFVAMCTTLEKPIEKTVKFNESHAHFLKDTPKENLLEFMQSRKLYVEIVGVRDLQESEVSNPAIFGTEEEDINISRRFNAYDVKAQEQRNKRKSPEVVLAAAQYDVSSLLLPTPTWIYVDKNSCHSVDHVIFPKLIPWDTLDFTDLITVQELHLKHCPKPQSVSPLTEADLVKYATCLKVEAYLQAPQNALLHVQSRADAFQRMLIIVKNMGVAMTLLNEIFLHNQEIYTPEVVAINYLKTDASLSHPSNVPFQPSFHSSINIGRSSAAPCTVLSGFMIDNTGYYTFFIEGTAKSYLTKIWKQFMNLNENTARIFFNTNQAFLSRLYEEFMPYGGFYTITLQAPLESILRQEGIYLRGNVPIPCFEALKKLDLLFRCQTFKSISQNNLLPTAKQLLSLDMEWGVPLRWRIRAQNQLTASTHPFIPESHSRKLINFVS